MRTCQNSGMRRRIGKRSRGFSLLELMAVLVVLGFLAGLSAPAISRSMENLEFRKQVGTIAAVLRYARLTAVAKGRPVEISLAAGEEVPTLRLAGAVKKLRPVGRDENDHLILKPAEIVFFPEGWVTPGVLTFTRGKRRQTISLDPLSGLPIFKTD